MYTPKLSVVIPLYNEQENIPALLDNLIAVLDGTERTYEVLLVNDGSEDSTWDVIESASVDYHNVKGVNLARNFGHQYALLAGMERASGKVIITMDGDLQHPAELIPEMLSLYDKGWFVVNTKRIYDEGASWFKKTSSKWFYKVFSHMTNIEMCEGSSDFRLIDSKVRDELLKFKDADLFIRGAVQWLGFSSTTIDYRANERLSGESKFTLSKMLNFATGSIISFSTKPLTIAINIGLFISLFAFLELMYILVQFASGESVPGWASILGIVSLMFGALFIVLGVIGTYIARVFTVLQGRPRYIIEKEAKGFTRGA